MPDSSAKNIVWDLSDLYAGVDDPRIEADLEACARGCKAFSDNYRGLFAEPGPDIPRLLEALVEYERLCAARSKLAAFSGLLTAADTASAAYQRLDDRTSQKWVEFSNLLAFFDIDWLEVPDARAVQIVADPRLANYAQYLSSSRRYKPHTRSEPEELLLNQKSLTARTAWNNLFDEYVYSLKYELDYVGSPGTELEFAL